MATTPDHYVTGYVAASMTERDGTQIVAIQRTAEDGGRVSLHKVARRSSIRFTIENAEHREYPHRFHFRNNRIVNSDRWKD